MSWTGSKNNVTGYLTSSQSLKATGLEIKADYKFKTPYVIIFIRNLRLKTIHLNISSIVYLTYFKLFHESAGSTFAVERNG